MHKVGIIGLGMMGATHLDVYAKREDTRVVAVADVDPDRRSGKTIAAGNIKGQAQGGFDFATAKQYAEGMDLIKAVSVPISPDVKFDDPESLVALWPDVLERSPLHSTLRRCVDVIVELRLAL